MTFIEWKTRWIFGPLSLKQSVDRTLCNNHWCAMNTSKLFSCDWQSFHAYPVIFIIIIHSIIQYKVLYSHMFSPLLTMNSCVYKGNTIPLTVLVSGKPESLNCCQTISFIVSSCFFFKDYSMHAISYIKLTCAAAVHKL